jgi:hypothetical protein
LLNAVVQAAFRPDVNVYYSRFTFSNIAINSSSPRSTAARHSTATDSSASPRFIVIPLAVACRYAIISHNGTVPSFSQTPSSLANFQVLTLFSSVQAKGG